MKALYTAVSTSTAGRGGHSKSSDGVLDIDLTPPKEMGGTGKGTNPEQLFASGYSACFGSAIDYVAKLQKKPLKQVEVTAHVTLNQNEDKSFALSVVLEVRVPELSRADAEEIVKVAHTVCPYSRGISGNVPVELKVVD